MGRGESLGSQHGVIGTTVEQERVNFCKVWVEIVACKLLSPIKINNTLKKCFLLMATWIFFYSLESNSSQSQLLCFQMLKGSWSCFFFPTRRHQCSGSCWPFVGGAVEFLQESQIHIDQKTEWTFQGHQHTPQGSTRDAEALEGKRSIVPSVLESRLCSESKGSCPVLQFWCMCVFTFLGISKMPVA